jgi:hypothetical protein
LHQTQKENFQLVDGEEVLETIRRFELRALEAAKHKRLRKAR